MTTRTGHHRRAHMDALTNRQREVLALVARGRTNTEIADELGIGFDTVKTHVSEILGKLGVNSREEAAAAWQANQGILGRIRRTASAFFVTGLGKAAAGTAAAIAIAGVASAIIFTGRDGSPASDDDPIALSTATSTPTATPTPEFADFGPTLTDAEMAERGHYPTPGPTATALPRLSDIDGKPVRDLVPGDPADLPDDLVLVYNVTCYGCGGGTNIHRAYRDATGTLRVDRLMPPIDGPRGGPEPYVHSFANDGLGTMFAAICEGYCGGEGIAQPGSTLELWLSSDGGITWEPTGESLPLETFFMGATNGEVLAQTVTFAADGGIIREYAWYPTKRPETPHPGFEDGYPMVSGALVIWRDQSGSPGEGAYMDIAVNGSKETVTAPREFLLVWRSLEYVLGEEMYWFGRQDGRPVTDLYFAVTNRRSGDVEHAFYIDGNDIRVTTVLADGRLLGNASYQDDSGTWAFRPVLIDLEAGTMHQVRGLPAGAASLDAPGGVSLGAHTFPRAVIYGTPRRVTTGDDCLYLREQPDPSAATLGCYADGVLFFQSGEANGEWIPVRDPQGNAGWAAAEFLE